MIIVLGGPIAHWWDNWYSDEAVSYRVRRSIISEELVLAGHLVYRPHEAFKGNWDARGQFANDAAVRACDLLIVLTPAGISSPGTDGEIELAGAIGKQIVYVDGYTVDEILEVVAALEALVLS